LPICCATRRQQARDLDDPATFHLIELWADEGALTARVRSVASWRRLSALRGVERFP
jgi:quinol monooxygenase YgiN